MRSLRCFLAIAFLVVSAAVLAVPTLDWEADQQDADAARGHGEPAPEQLYPDADFIFTPYEDESVMITFKERTPTDDDPDAFRWSHRIIHNGDDYEIAKWSKLTTDLTVVYDGPKLDRLNVINIDDASATQKFVSVDFRMMSGTIGTLTIVDVAKGEVKRLGTDYDHMFNPLENASVDLEGGRINTFCPTTQMIYVDNMEVTVGTDMMVDRFLTSGENGRYGNLYVGLYGGSVGIMTNMKARIGSITYELDAGSVDYFSIGANTEMSGNMYMVRACTSYISGDVDVYIDPSVTVHSAIIGGGVIETPNILWNGQVLAEPVVKNISIEAHEQTFTPDMCFLNEKRNKTFLFQNYRVGSIPPTTSVSVNCTGPDGTSMKVYGPEGIWGGCSSVTAHSGISIFTNTVFAIPSDADVNLEMGSKMVFTHHTIVSGELNILGEAVNNYIVEIRGDGRIDGRLTGTGITAEEIVSNPVDSRITVDSDLDSVLIRQDGTQTVTEITSNLMGGKTKVSITSKFEGVGFVNSTYLVSLREIIVSDSFASGFDLYIGGIDDKTLTACNVDITIPADVPEGKVPKVYLFVPDDREYREIEIIDTSDRSITFRTGAEGEYSLMYTDEYVPDVPVEPVVPEVKKDDTAEIVVLVLGICVTLAIMAYTTFRFRK